MKETELYKPVSLWLTRLLSDRYPRSKASTFDTHKVTLAKFLATKGLDEYFSESAAYDIKVDVLGVVQNRQSARLVLVECKTKPIRLLDVGQLVGYARIVQPLAAFLVSPSGSSQPLQALLRTFGRYDILQYAEEKQAVIATWRHGLGDVDHSSLLPPGPLNLDW